MIPKGVENGRLILKCVRCGYEIKVDKKITNDYRLKFQVEEDKRIFTSKATEAKELGLSPEEREMLQEYYEVFLESFQEEEGGED